MEETEDGKLMLERTLELWMELWLELWLNPDEGD